MSTYTERVTVTRSELVDLGDLCDGIAVRGGIEEPCCHSATTAVYDAESARPWPACTWHAHRYGGALTVAQIREALTTGATSFERQVNGE